MHKEIDRSLHFIDLLANSGVKITCVIAVMTLATQIDQRRTCSRKHPVWL
jgi:hypothetical protein